MDVPRREKWERDLARVLGKLNRSHMARLLEYLGDPPRIENVPPGFWDEAGEDLRKALGPILEEVYVEQAAELIQGLPVGVDWALINEAAVEWARRYSFELVTGINSTSRRALQKAVSSYFEMGLTRADLEGRLVNIFGPVRAEMIAVTEVTRAASQGEMAIAQDLRGQGISMVAIWQTNNDELVCPICGPRHGKKRGDGWDDPPPAHPRCRCWINHELPKVA